MSICHRAVKCGWKGNAVTLISELLDLSYEEAKTVLNEGSGASIKEILAILQALEKDPYKPLPDTVWIEGAERLLPEHNHEGVGKWLRKRGYDHHDFLTSHQVYLPPTGLYDGRVVFEVTTDKLRAYQLYDYTGLKEKKTINPKHEFLSRTLFEYEEWKNEELDLLIHEGIFDVARSKVRGFAATCVFGTNISDTQKYLLSKSKIKNVYIVLDGDTRNEDLKKDKAWQMACQVADIGKPTYLVRIPKDEDPDSILESQLEACLQKAYRVLSKSELLYARL